MIRTLVDKVWHWHVILVIVKHSEEGVATENEVGYY